MTNVVSIRFKNRGKLYYFDPNGVKCHVGDTVVVETAKGLELGECIRAEHPVAEESVVLPLRPIVRTATKADIAAVEANRRKAKSAAEICRGKIAEHGLEMKLVDVEYNFEGNKIVFFFTSDGRVDFRELVKDLASVFHMRIELRQIGVRDEAKMLGGLGMCGKPFCCSQFLNDFQPVSTKMAKTQSLSLNPTKISGTCGRLMCCLRYEQEAYEDLLKEVPKAGTYVNTPMGPGSIEQVQLLRKRVKVKLDGTTDNTMRTYETDEIAVVPGGRPKPGEECDLPPVTAKEKAPEENSRWPILINETEMPKKAEAPAQSLPKSEKPQQHNHKRNRPHDGAGAPKEVSASKAEAAEKQGTENKTNWHQKKSSFHHHKPTQNEGGKKPESAPKAETAPKTEGEKKPEGGKKPNYHHRYRNYKKSKAEGAPKQ